MKNENFPSIKCDVVFKPFGFPEVIIVYTGCFVQCCPVYSNDELNIALMERMGGIILRTSDGKKYDCLADFYHDESNESLIKELQKG